MTVIAKNKSLEFPEIAFSIRDPGSALTHFIGFIAAATAAPFLISLMIHRGHDGLTMTGCLLFLLGLLSLYGASTCYHTFTLTGRHKNTLKKLDHMMIFVLIAGTYSPLCLGPIRGILGFVLFGIIWGLALLGMIFKFCWVTCPKWISSVLYIGMGWACVFAIPTIWHTMPHAAFYWLLAGGILYTVGGVIYALRFDSFNRSHPYFGTHEIFHLFVMGGSICHFIFIFQYI